MPSREIDSKQRYELGFNFQDVVGNGTLLGNPVDLQGVESVQFIMGSGIITDGVHVFALEESDDIGFSSPNTVVDADLRGAISTDLVFSFTADNESRDVGYVGNKRFIRMILTSSGVTVGGAFGGTVVKANLSLAPAS